MKRDQDRARDQLIDELNQVVAQFSDEEARLFFSAISLRNFLRAGGKFPSAPAGGESSKTPDAGASC